MFLLIEVTFIFQPNYKMDKVDSVINILGIEYLQKLPFVVKASKKTKIPENILILSSIIVVGLFCLSVVFGTLVTTTAMFLFPAYDTFKAIENKQTENQSRLLTYWIVFGTFFAMDESCRWALSFVPYYHLIRFAFLYALYSKSINGAEMIFTHIQKPLFDKFSKQIEQIVAPVETTLNKIALKVVKNE